MKKAEAERTIRRLVREWFRGLPAEEREDPSYYLFKEQAHDRGHGAYWGFRSRMGADYDAELWFDQELGQTWRR